MFNKKKKKIFNGTRVQMYLVSFKQEGISTNTALVRCIGSYTEYYNKCNLVGTFKIIIIRKVVQ